MQWFFDSTKIFPQTYNIDKKQIIARLNPLGGGTVLHFFGYENETIKMTVMLAGETNLGVLLAAAEDGAGHYIIESGTGVSITSVYVNNITANRLPVIYQTFDPSEDCDAVVYSVDMELYM